MVMNILKRQTIISLGLKYPCVKKQLDVWYQEVRKAKWKNSTDIKKEYPKASIIGSKRVVFDLVGGEYRLIVKAEYEFQVVLIMFFGTHREYDKVEVEKVDNY